MVKTESLVFYSVDEVAEMFKASPDTIRAYHREGKIAGRKVGKSLYFTEKAIAEFLAGHGPQEPSISERTVTE